MSRSPQTTRLYVASRYDEQRVGWPVSVFVHGMLLAILIFAEFPSGGAPQASPEEGVQMVFESGANAPVSTPSTQQSTPAPQINLLPPEMIAPPVPPPTEEAPAPAPRPVVRQDKPRRRANPQSNPFANMGLPNFAAMPQGPRHGVPRSRGLDLSMGPIVQGGQLRDLVPHIASDGADGDYMGRLSDYVETHKFYPELAGRNGEQGTVVARVLISRDGTVKDVHLEQSSESRMLDVALMSMFRHKHLPPFPDDMKENEREFTISMTYEIIYQ